MVKKKTNSSKDLKDERKREQLAELYRTRLGYLKKAQTFVREDRMALAVDSYNKYLGILALYFDTTEDRLSPTLFDAEKDMTELLLISHAYWDLAKAYDRSPNLQRDCVRCLEQFIKFSIGFKYQHVNAQIIRKFNNKKQAHNPKAFEMAYQRIQVSSKRCYIATMCFGFDDHRTVKLRYFKLWLAKYKLGLDFIDFYYANSPHLVNYLEQKPILKSLFNYIAYPILSTLVFIITFITRLHDSHKKTHS